MKKILFCTIFLLIGVGVSLASEQERSVTYVVNENGSLTIEGLEPSGSVAEFVYKFSDTNKMEKNDYCILTLKNYDGYIIKGLTLMMHSNKNAGAGTFSFKIGNNTLEKIFPAKTFNEWFENSEYTNQKKNVNVTYGEGYKVEKNEEIEINISASANSLYIYAYTIIYEKPEDLVDIPRITPTKGEVFYRKQQINISCEADVDAIYFTTDGTEPTTTSQKYDENLPLYIDKEITIKAFAIKDNEQTKVNEKTFKKDNLKAIVTKFDGNFYGMTKKKRVDNGHLIAKSCSVYHDSIVLCNPENLTTFAWLINDETIQDYESSQYLYNINAYTLLGETQTKWNICSTQISLSDNSRFLGHAIDANKIHYFAAYEESNIDDSLHTLAYPMNLSKGYTRNDLSPNKFGTICLPYDVLNDDRIGATFYNIAGKKTDENNNVISLILEEETGTLIAGRPYIFEATDNALCCMYLDIAEEGNAAQAGNHNGLYGRMEETPVKEGMYLISDNKVVKCGEGCSIAANRAFIDMEEVKELNETQHLSERMLTISIGEGNSTNIKTAERENTNNLVIYNIQGQRVVAPSKGLYIVNGKKTIIK